VHADPDIKKLEHKEVRHNIRRAERAHVKYDEIRLKAPQFHPPDDLREEIDAGLKRWQEHRHGTQIAAVRPLLLASSRCSRPSSADSSSLSARRRASYRGSTHNTAATSSHETSTRCARSSLLAPLVLAPG